MQALHFERDEITSLWKWPVFLNGDWSQWTDEPCTILWGQFDQYDYKTRQEIVVRAGQLLGSPLWPGQTSFQVGRGGILIIAPTYSSSQAFLLADSLNHELHQIQTLEPSPYGRAGVTWATIKVANPNWNLPATLRALLFSVNQALRESRWGSINEVCEPDHSTYRDDFFVSYSRDSLTGLHFWRHTLALCSRYGDEPIALLMGDLDHFKHINDLYGPAGGDLTLQMLSHVLHRFESNDVAVFRAGDDEFYLWTRGYSLRRAEKLAQDINEATKSLHIPMPYTDNVESVSLTWSIIAASPRNLELHQLVHKANERLHVLKSEQRGSIGTLQI